MQNPEQTGQSFRSMPDTHSGVWRTAIPDKGGHPFRVMPDTFLIFTPFNLKTDEMAQKRVKMRKVRELFRLKFEEGYSTRQAAKTIGIGKTAASEYISGFNKSELTLSQARSLPDKDLLAFLNTHSHEENTKYKELASQFNYIEKELKRPGVTLQLLWQEYREGYPEGYGYSQYCHHFYQWRKSQKVSMHIEHKAGDKLYVDFAGKKLQVVSPQTGEINEYEVFMAVLGCRQMKMPYSFLEGYQRLLYLIV